MLVLTRKSEQRIQIGSNITITILRVKGGTVRVGVEAPADMKILRSELSPLPEPEAGAKKAGGRAQPAKQPGVAPVAASARRDRTSDGSESGEENPASDETSPGATDPRRSPLVRWHAAAESVRQEVSALVRSPLARASAAPC